MPPPRPYWKGYIKLALVSCPIALYTASSSSERARRLPPDQQENRQSPSSEAR
jgi:non-homologous end joining protein Ku